MVRQLLSNGWNVLVTIVTSHEFELPIKRYELYVVYSETLTNWSYKLMSESVIARFGICSNRGGGYVV